jgi:cell division protein FtsB
VTGSDGPRAEQPRTCRPPGKPDAPGSTQARPLPPRPHFTGRAAVLAIVLCGIALSLAYPVREYISQRKQIDQLLAQGARIESQRQRLESERRLLRSPVYIEQQARDRLHMCLPTQMCYEIIGKSAKPKDVAERVAGTPWYARLWSSVQQADGASDGASVKIRNGTTGSAKGHRRAQPSRGTGTRRA